MELQLSVICSYFLGSFWVSLALAIPAAVAAVLIEDFSGDAKLLVCGA